MKKQRKIEKDNRGVAIYARKSRITNKGDSIGVQFKQCADYATVGKNTKAITEYIADQLKRDKEADQLSIFDPRDPFTGSK